MDANLLVLFIIGSVNPTRIRQFKRTSQYSIGDFEILVAFMEEFESWYTLAHVMSEVSNLTGLAGDEGLLARRKLKDILQLAREPWVESRRAAACRDYEDLGLTDAAIITAARDHDCTVITADLDLYLALQREEIPAINFAHLQSEVWDD